MTKEVFNYTLYSNVGYARVRYRVGSDYISTYGEQSTRIPLNREVADKMVNDLLTIGRTPKRPIEYFTKSGSNSFVYRPDGTLWRVNFNDSVSLCKLNPHTHFGRQILRLVLTRGEVSE